VSEFGLSQADEILERIALHYGVTVRSRGKGVMRSFSSYDAYVPVDNGQSYRASLAIRFPKDGTDGTPYIAIRRKSARRNVVEDRFSVADLELAEEYFAICVKITQRGLAVETLGMRDDPAADNL